MTRIVERMFGLTKARIPILTDHIDVRCPQHGMTAIVGVGGITLTFACGCRLKFGHDLSGWYREQDIEVIEPPKTE